jgi:hypothetical protein
VSALEDAIAENRAAATRLLATARGVPKEKWAQPVAPRKWSPAQIVDHIVVATEVALKAIKGDASMGSIPRFLRFIPRVFGFNATIKKGKFPEKQRGPAAFAPSTGHPTYEASAERLERALVALEMHIRALAAANTHSFEHSFFGRVGVADYVRFGAFHMVHHEKQLHV